MNTDPNSLESKEKINSSAKENEDIEKVAQDLKFISDKKKLFITNTIIPIETFPSLKSNNIASKIKFITTIDCNKENKKKEKEQNKTSPFLIPKIEYSKINIINNYIIINYS